MASTTPAQDDYDKLATIATSTFVTLTPQHSRTLQRPTTLAGMNQATTSAPVKSKIKLVRPVVPVALSPFQETLRAHLAATTTNRTHFDSSPTNKTRGDYLATNENLVPLSSAAKRNEPPSSTSTVDHSSCRTAASSSPSRQERQRCRVAFSDTPMAPINATPRHSRRYHPFANSSRQTRHQPAPLDSLSINLETPPSSESPSHVLSSPTRKQETVKQCDKPGKESSRSPRERTPSDESDQTTDDEAEEVAVEILLLSQAQLAASPPRIRERQARLFPAPGVTCESSPTQSKLVLEPLPAPASILKRPTSTTPSRFVKSAAEGLKWNGRTKHALNFEAETADTNSPERATKRRAPSKTSSAAPASSSSSSAYPMTRRTSRAANNGNNEDDGGGDRRDRRPRPINDGRIVWNVQDDDPVHFDSPLRVLAASLRPTNGSQPRSRDPRAIADMAPPFLVRQTSPSRQNAYKTAAPARTESDTLNERPFLPPNLGEIEHAYSRLVRATLKAPIALTTDVATFEPLRRHQHVFRKCIERDLSNIVNFSTWSTASMRIAPNTVSSPPARDANGKNSLTEDHLRRLKDEIAIAQVAIKACAALLQHANISAIFRAVVNVARCADPPMLVYKDVFPFVSWFLSVQCLSTEAITKHMADILKSLNICLNTPDKMRHNQEQGAAAVAHLVSRHPRQMLEQNSLWLKPLMVGLWDTAKRGGIVRSRTVNALGVIADVLTRDGSSEWRENQLDWRDQVSKQVLDIFSDSPAGAPQGITNLELLVSQLKLSVQSTQSLSTEMQWASLHTFLAVLPILLGPRLRRLDPKGITPYVELFALFAEVPAAWQWQLVSGLLWCHLAFTFFLVPPTRTHGGKVEEQWLFRRDAKQQRQLVLFNVFNHRRPPEMKPGAEDKHSEKRESNALVLGHVLLSIVAAYSILLHNSAPPELVPASEVDPVLSKTDLENFDSAFENGISREIKLGATSSIVDAQRLALGALAGLVAPRTKASRIAPMEMLVNRELYLDVPNKIVSPDNFVDWMNKAVSSAVQPEAIPGWGSQWVITRIDKIVNVLLHVIEADDGRIDDSNLLFVWTSLFNTIANVFAQDASNHVTENERINAVRVVMAGISKLLSSANNDKALDHVLERLRQDTGGLGEPTGGTERSCSWSTLARQLGDVFCIEAQQSQDSHEVGTVLGALFAAPLVPEVSIGAFKFLFQHGEAMSQEVQDMLAHVACECIYELCANPDEEIIQQVARLLKASTMRQFASLYPAALSSLDPSTDSNSVGLLHVMPVLSQIVRLYRHGYQAIECYASFVKFWASKFDGNVVVPKQLVDVLWLGQRLAGFKFEDEVGDTQSMSQASHSILLPPPRDGDEAITPAPAQLAGSAQPSERAIMTSTADEKRSAAAQEEEHDADVSRSLTGGRLNPSTSTVAPGLERPAQPSPSLQALTHEASLEQSPSVQEETPREVELARARASFAPDLDGGSSAPAATTRTTLAPRNEVVALRGALPASSDSDRSRSASPAASSSLSIGHRRQLKGKKRARQNRQGGTPMRSRSKSPQSAEEGPSSKRRKGQVDDDTIVPATVDVASSSRDGSPNNSTHDETVRQILAMPLDTVVKTAKRVGGSPGLHRFIELGEHAKRFFQRRSRQ
ncbi:hypothetical protein OIO90_003755 [Microbotryomycetes sp. JL221]|nr:hypothetical protein OIO90_003755 [Microbotryomycetes sp. JL221]